MNWARRLGRVFGIEIAGRTRRGDKLKIIASTEEPEVIASILAHLQHPAPKQFKVELPVCTRARSVRKRHLGRKSVQFAAIALIGPEIPSPIDARDLQTQLLAVHADNDEMIGIITRPHSRLD
jgi:hypothetical protein